MKQLHADGKASAWKNVTYEADPGTGNFLSTSGITRMAWRLHDVAEPSSSEIVYTVDASIGEPYNATIVQDPNPPPNADSITTGYYAGMHATWPSKTSRDIGEDKKTRRSTDHFNGPFTPIPWSQSFITVFTDGCSSTLTTTVTDAAGTVTTFTNSLNTDGGQLPNNNFPADAVLPMTINMTTSDPFRGSVVGTVGESPFQIALGEDAPSLYSYYQISAYFCGTQEDD
ncbi:hypothetical protein HMN09_00468600 [Mycena chlorophos]|uniref:Uncharacterized protein n=1 Tax=Mycena chlorophos TaxID=658473 RepID=A0A8H6THJ2_MYCCL|nr:hypothetical protein HMN09_00468600 [Mycena chlorophos]